MGWYFTLPLVAALLLTGALVTFLTRSRKALLAIPHLGFSSQIVTVRSRNVQLLVSHESRKGAAMKNSDMKKATVRWIYEMRLERIRKLPRYQVRKPKHKKAQP